MSSIHKITVAIPVYNGEKYIHQALQSIVDQTKKVDDIIVCDNQSTDNTLQIVKDFFSKHKDFNCLLHQNPVNLGYQKNFNKCMELCKTEYLLLLSSDDVLKINTIETHNLFLEKNDAFAVVGGWSDNIDKNGKLISQPSVLSDQFYRQGEILEFVEKHGLFLHPSSVLMRMSQIRTIGYWDEYLGPDERFWPRVLKKYAIAVLKDSYVNRRIHLGQTARLDYISKYKELILSFKANLAIASIESTDERRKKLSKVLHAQVANSSIMMGSTVWRYYGKSRIALKYWLYGIGCYPGIILKKDVFRSIEKTILYRILVFSGNKK